MGKTPNEGERFFFLFFVFKKDHSDVSNYIKKKKKEEKGKHTQKKIGCFANQEIFESMSEQ